MTPAGALVMYPAGTGSPRRLCDLCAPPRGTEPPAFYFDWAPKGEFAYWNFNGATYAIPLQSADYCRTSPLEESNPRKVSPLFRAQG